MVNNNHIRKVLLLLFALVFLLSAHMVFSTIYENCRSEEVFEELQSLLVETSAVSESTEIFTTKQPETEAKAEKNMLTRFVSIYEKNPDIFGWIAIDGTDLSYPVMHTPEEPEYYLRRAFDKSDSQSGVPFLAGACTETSGNYLVYGHNMKNGSMFAPLLSYAEEDFWREHPVIHFDTLYKAGSYKVVAAFYTEVYKQSEQEVFRYYQYTNLRDPAVFNEYVKQVKNSAIYDTGISATYGETLLTLSTCNYHTENGRFVVVAKKVDSK